MYMESDIREVKKFLAFKIINTISFLAMRISNKNATAGTIVTKGKICGIT